MKHSITRGFLVFLVCRVFTVQLLAGVFPSALCDLGPSQTLVEVEQGPLLEFNAHSLQLELIVILLQDRITLLTDKELTLLLKRKMLWSMN